jgi:Zn-dependent protease
MIIVWILLAVALHEGAHAATALALGVRVYGVSIFGLMLQHGGNPEKLTKLRHSLGVGCIRDAGLPRQNALISLAGPMANLLTAYACVTLHRGAWLWFASVVIGGVNLLPIPGSDGLRAMKLLRRAKA